jgi:hypothetical protein
MTDYRMMTVQDLRNGIMAHNADRWSRVAVMVREELEARYRELEEGPVTTTEKSSAGWLRGQRLHPRTADKIVREGYALILKGYTPDVIGAWLAVTYDVALYLQHEREKNRNPRVKG